MKVINVFLISVISVCCTKQDFDATDAEYYVGDRDSLLVNFLLTQFNTFHYNQSSIEEQLKWLRSGFSSTYTRSINGRFGTFNFKSFRFDSHAHTPFAVEVSNDENKVIFLFTFTDEIFYNINDLRVDFISGRLFLKKMSSNDSALVQKLNLEKNLNAIIKKLNFERDAKAIIGVIDTLFRKVLEIETYDDSEIDMILGQVEKLSGEQKVIDLVCSEYNQFMDSPTDNIFRFRSFEGSNGYWRIWVVEKDGVYTVKTKFFCDVLFTSVHM